MLTDANQQVEICRLLSEKTVEMTERANATAAVVR
jgi:hypothetical protein